LLDSAPAPVVAALSLHDALPIYLHDDAVDEVGQLVSPLQHGAPVGVDLLHRLGAPAIGGEAKAKAGQPLHAFAVQRELRRAAEDLVGIEDEGTGSGDAGVELAQGAGGSVARVGEGPVASFLLAPVELGEI